MRIAIATACILVAAPSFSRAEATCFVMVAREMVRRSAGRGGQSSYVCELFHYARELQLHVALPLRARQSA